MTERNNICLCTDSYKLTQFRQYPEKTTMIFDYLESRGGEYDRTVMALLQYYLVQYLAGEVVTKEMVEEAKELVDAHMGPGIFHYDGWMHIVDKHKGHLPVEIKAVPEGTIVETHNVLLTIVNTDPECYWLTGYLETLLMKVWSGINVATISLECKKIIKEYLEMTADDLEGLPFKLHDFGYRGVSSEESAGTNGLAHLFNFMGTDTLKGILFAKKYYGEPMAGYSIPATEHSTMTTLGREGEYEQMDRFLDVYADSPIKACVSDSYDIYKAIEFWGTRKEKLKEQGSILVVRPDSGDPVAMSLECCVLLDKEFGHTKNKKGYKLLDQVRVIYGDGISSPKVIRQILENAEKENYSADNFAFGMGGGLLQKNDRDTQRFAMKCSAAVVDGKVVEVFKDPITDKGKTSKKGFLDLVKVGDKFATVKRQSYGDYPDSELKTVFKDGKLLNLTTLSEIRQRLADQGY